VVASVSVRVGLIGVLLGAWGLDLATSGPSVGDPNDPEPSRFEEVCIDSGIAGSGLDQLIRVAVEVLRQSGHDPEDYRLDLRMDEVEGARLIGPGANLQPGVVFLPVAGRDRYALRVDRSNPCVVSWLWQPQNFTAWQRRVIERAREVMRDAWPDGASERLSGVEVIETAAEVSVRLLLGDADESGRVPSRAEITLRKSDLSAVD